MRRLAAGLLLMLPGIASAQDVARGLRIPEEVGHRFRFEVGH